MKTNKILSLITAAVCAVNIAAPAFAESEYISIKSASDIILLSRNCISDSYSVGKVFVLLNDIDLSDTDFEPIGSFGGTFDGGGYTISGLDIEAVDSVRGFIGTVAETGVVKNLNVSGSISPKNEYEKSNFSKISGIISGGDNDSLLKGVERYTSNQGLKSIGGIAGENKGRITNCTYSGTVSGYENIGGIVGENYESGRIECCTNAAVVTGTMNTGGIAGKNYGLIKWSYNNGLINPEANENAQNTGGIAGRSYGAVTESVNNAEIGYKNAGYNTGGITGCQNGYIAECTNYGHIQGRKDIGGITGQFEPYTNINFDEDEFQQRWEENTEKLKSDLREADDEISNKYDTLKSDIDDFFGINERRDSFNDTVGDISDSVSDLNGRIGDSVEDTNGRIADSVDDASGRLSDRISDAVDTLDEIGGEVSDASGRIADRMTESGDNFDSSLNDAVDVLERLGDNADDMRADSANTTEAVINLLDAASASLESGEVNREELINSLIDALEDLDMGGVDVNVDADMSAISRSIREIANNFNDNMDDIAEPMIRISDAIDDFLDAYESKSGDIDEFIENLKNLRDEIAETPAPSNSSSASEPTEAPALIPTIPPINQDTLDNIIDIIGNLFAMSGTTAYAEEDMSTTRKLLEMDIKDMDISINRRVAGESMDAALIKYCINEGAVDGVSDIGGIAGAVGFDSQNNPEDNLNVSGDYSLNPSTAIKAVINASINEGKITAKNTSAGGIVGFADIGSVKQSMSGGEVTVTEGNYAGGIAGYSANNITKSISVSDISALGYAGGIAGKGTNIDTCYALTRIDSDGEKLGAIAGMAEGNIRYNYFLDEGLSGIAGVNYEAKAEPKSKEVMVSSGELSKELTGFDDKDWYVGGDDKYLPQLKAFTENDASGIGDTLKLKSSDFARFIFRVRFFVDEEEVKTLYLNYGEKIPKDEIPRLEKRNAQYGVWDKDVEQKIVRNTDFYSQYEHSTTTIAYGSEPAIMLVEGNFRPGTVLDVEESSANVFENGSYATDRKYSFTVTEDIGEYSGEVTVRIMDKSGGAVIGVMDGGNVNIVDSEVDGSYIKFTMAEPGEFLILRRKPNYALYAAIAAAAAAAVAAVFIIRRKKKKQISMQ